MPSDAFTRAPDHSTAAELGKQYHHGFASDGEAAESSSEDGYLSSAEYAAQVAQTDNSPEALQLEYSHPLEAWAAKKHVRWLLKRLTSDDRHGRTMLEKVISSYRNPQAPSRHRAIFWLMHKLIDRFRGSTDPEVFREKLAENRAVLQGVVLTARSLAEFGPSTPQRFSFPLFAVWNFTNACNLACRHCYQDSDHDCLANELTLEEKLQAVDQMGRAHMPMLALSGGEPTISKHLLPVIERASGYGMHISLATNGTTMTREYAANLRKAGLRYVEISLDSTDPERHDLFRGGPGMWERTVQGMRNVIATEGLRLGVAMCVHQGNLHEVEDMIRFAEDIGADAFAHFNFIPVGRGLKMVSGDITPSQREELLALLNRKMQEDGIGIISTAPQLGRVCLAGAALESGKVTCSHAGSGSGVKARVVAKYLGGCGAGRTYVCIEPDGNVTPCVYLPHRVMGNLRDRPLAEIYRDGVFWDVLNNRDERLHHCRVCSYKEYCGGCRARADAYFGQLHAGDPGCVFNEKHWEKLVADGVAVDEGAPARAEDLNLSATRCGPG
ncbi:MAG: radical SAM protein [Phycisphaerae bacterium]